MRNTVRTNPNQPHGEAKKPEIAEKKTTIPTSEAEYENFANEVLFHLYPKYCPEHKIQLTRLISTRKYAIKCSKCRHQQSRFSYTPMHHLKLPLWMWGWAIWESVNRYPQVLTSSEIQRRLGIAKNSALLLKRRIQLFATQQTDRIKELMHKELQERFEDVKLPHVSLQQNVNEVLQGRSVPHVDSVVLFSASQRANGGRKRHKHTGQTASIYMNNKLGGRQIGTLVHTLAIKNGPVILDSVSNNRGETLRPLLDSYVPKDVPVFSDEGYKWYYRINKNHRMVNHNRKSEDKRYKWARNRWSINGVNNQTAEGFQRNLKWHFGAGYGYIRPEYSQLYLNEYSFWKNVKYYGWDKLILSDEENRKVAEERKNTGSSTEEHKTTEKEKRVTAPNSNGLKEKDGSKQRGRVNALPNQQTRLVGLENAVIEGNSGRFEVADAMAATSCTGTGEPGFRRFFAENAPQRSGTLSGPRRGVCIRDNKNAQAGWLEKSIETLKYHPPTLEEREIAEKNRGDDFLETALGDLIQKPENERLRAAVDDFKSFESRKSKHEILPQKQYAFAAARIWEYLGDGEWLDLDSIVEATGVNRARAYRIIRRWAMCGIASVVDRSLPDGLNFKYIYDVRREITALPDIRYVLNKAEFKEFEGRYAQFISKQYVQRKQKSKF